MSTESNDQNDPRAVRDVHFQRVNGFKEETRREVQERKKQLDELRERRQELRMAAATSAGNIGLRYVADANSYVRLIGSAEDEIVLQEYVSRPDPLEPDLAQSSVSVAPQDGPAYKEGKHSKMGETALHIFVWILMIVPGAFIGIGLVTIAGMNWKVNPAIIPYAWLLGISVICGLKILLAQLWRLVAHAHALGEAWIAKFILASTVTLGGVALDANLGAMALHTYLEAKAFRASDVPPYAVLFWLAMAIAGPLLLASAALSYLSGKKEPTTEEREAKRRELLLDRLEKERQDRKAKAEAEREKYREALLAKIDSDYGDKVDQAKRKYDALKALDNERAEDWANLKNHAEFKCLQGLIGQIGVLTVEIAEKERELTNYKISRGFEKSSEFPNGKPMAQITNNTTGDSEPQEPVSDGAYVS